MALSRCSVGFWPRKRAGVVPCTRTAKVCLMMGEEVVLKRTKRFAKCRGRVVGELNDNVRIGFSRTILLRAPLRSLYLRIKSW